MKAFAFKVAIAKAILVTNYLEAFHLQLAAAGKIASLGQDVLMIRGLVTVYLKGQLTKDGDLVAKGLVIQASI